MIKVLLFGPVAEHCQMRELSIDYREGVTLSDMRQSLEEEFPGVEKLVAMAAINGVRRNLNSGGPVLQDGDEVVFMSPFSGG